MRRDEGDPSRDLTARQREVLALLRRGLTNEEIARELGITLDGAKWHVSEIIARLGVRDRYEAAQFGERTVPTHRGWSVLPFGLGNKVGAVGVAAGAVAVAAALAGIGVLIWGVAGTDPTNDERTSPGRAWTGDADVDDVINLIVARDVEGLLPHALFTPVGEEAPDSTPVVGFTVGQCEGAILQNEDEVRQAFGLALQRQPSAAVYAILRENADDRPWDSYWVAITEDRPAQATADVDFWNIRDDGRIVHLQNECGPVGAAQQVAYRFPSPDFVMGPFNQCSPSAGETANFMVTVEGLSPGSIEPQFWGPARSTIGTDTGERAIVTVMSDTVWTGDIDRLEDVRVGMELQAVGIRQEDCTIKAQSILTPGPNVFRSDNLGVEFPYSFHWTEGAASMPYATCSGCVTLGPSEVQCPYGVSVSSADLDEGCTPSCYNTIRALPLTTATEGVADGRRSSTQEFERQAPLGLAADTGDSTPYREIWTIVFRDQDVVVLTGFWREGDVIGERYVRQAYDRLLAELDVL